MSLKRNNGRGCKAMNVYECIMKRRTVRKFRQEEVNYDDIVKLIECARVATYGANLQPIKF